MQKVVSVNIIKSMLPVIKSKFNTKLTRRMKELKEQHEKSKSFFNKKEYDDNHWRREALREGICGLDWDKSFIEDLETCIKNSGDVVLEVRELNILHKMYEEEI